MIELTEWHHQKIHELVMQRFPKLQTERSCITEKRMREAAREAYRKRLTDDVKAEKILLA